MSLYGTPPEEPGTDPAPAASTPDPVTRSCSAGGNSATELGYIEDGGEGSDGISGWIPGPIQRGIFGQAKRAGRVPLEVITMRCTFCDHLDMYAVQPPPPPNWG